VQEAIKLTAILQLKVCLVSELDRTGQVKIKVVVRVEHRAAIEQSVEEGDEHKLLPLKTPRFIFILI
jgi:hypothetical protein